MKHIDSENNVAYYVDIGNKYNKIYWKSEHVCEMEEFVCGVTCKRLKHSKIKIIHRQEASEVNCRLEEEILYFPSELLVDAQEKEVWAYIDILFKGTYVGEYHYVVSSDNAVRVEGTTCSNEWKDYFMHVVEAIIILEVMKFMRNRIGIMNKNEIATYVKNRRLEKILNKKDYRVNVM